MTKLRHPHTIEDAVAQIIALLGREEAAKAAGRSASLVYAWGDPDQDETPNVRHALALDAACKRVHGVTPILAAMTRQLEAVDMPTTHDVCINDVLLDLHCDVGRLSDAVREGKAPTGPGGTRFTLQERRRVAMKIQTLKRRLDTIERACAGDNEPALKVVGAAE